MMELTTVYPYGLSKRYGDELKKTESMHINVAKKIPSLPRKHNRINHGSLQKGFCKRSPH